MCLWLNFTQYGYVFKINGYLPSQDIKKKQDHPKGVIFDIEMKMFSSRCVKCSQNALIEIPIASRVAV
jgi:hypothetical protein